MTVYRLKRNTANGDVAIYSVPSHDSTDDTPLTDPYADPSRLQWHSGMICPSTTPALTQQVEITIPAQASSSKYSGQINLFEHGKGEPCMVEGLVLDLDGPGGDVAFNGTLPIDTTATGHATWLALGATDTHVVVVYFGITHAARAARTLTIEASAYDFLASGPADTSDPELPSLKHVKDSYLQLGRGKFDTRRRYLRQVDGGGDFALATGPTLSIIGKGNTGAHPSGEDGSWVQYELGWRWRYSCGGYIQQTTQGWNGASTNGGTYNAPHILVRR